MTGHVALERAMSKLRLASRSEAQRLVRAGAVTVNGRVVTDPLAPVVPERDAIAVAGKTQPAPAWRTIAFHKYRIMKKLNVHSSAELIRTAILGSLTR